jgi:hypothetical protein
LPATPATDDAATNAEFDKPAAVNLDDLFGGLRPAVDPAKEDESGSAAQEAADFDPFAQAADQPEELPSRLWTDNTGHFQIRGRLAVILDGKIRIFKENGRFTTVPVDRLSRQDRDYVEQKIAEYGQGEIGRVAAR